MVYFSSSHPSPETATPLLSEIIAEALQNARTCHLNGRFFCAPASPPTRSAQAPEETETALFESELLGIARDFSFLYDADTEVIYAELHRQFIGRPVPA